VPLRDAWSRFLNRPERLIDLHDDRSPTVGRAADMPRSLLRFAVLAGPLTLPALAGCAPVGLIDQALGLFGHSSPTAATNIASANPVGVSPLSASTTCANIANANTASTNPTGADSGSASIVSRVTGWFGHSSPTASVNPTSTDSGSPSIVSQVSGLFGQPSPTASINPTSANPISANGSNSSAVSQVAGLFGHPSPAASVTTASVGTTSVSTDSLNTASLQAADLQTANLNTASVNTASVNTASVNPTSADPTSAESGSSSKFGWLSGLFGHRSPTAEVNPLSTSADNGTASPLSLGTILSMRLVPATDQSSAAMGSGTNATTGAHAGGTAPSLRIAGVGGGPMGMRTGTGMDGGGMAGTQTAQGRAAGPATGPATGQATEFTIRMDGGSTLIVVQGDSQGLLPGDQVQLIPGVPTRVARAD
jgi:outer membrane lipoprotein SlyB